jgi:hypothetical protein
MPKHYTFTLKMAAAMFAETLNNSLRSTKLIPETEITHYIHMSQFINEIMVNKTTGCVFCISTLGLTKRRFTYK